MSRRWGLRRRTASGPPVLYLGPAAWVGGLGVMRSLGQLGVEVHILRHRGISTQRLARFCAGTVVGGVAARPAGEENQVVQQLLEAGGRLGRGTILMAGTDEWALLMADHQAELGGVFSFPAPPPAIVRRLADKRGLRDMAHQHGVASPRLVVPGNRAEAHELAGELTYPVFLKPVLSRPDVETKAVAANSDQLLDSYARLEESADQPNVMFQEYIPGGDDTVWMFDGYFDDASRCLFGITGKKLRQLPAHMGHCSLGRLVQNEDVVELTTRFLGALGYRGIVDIGYRFDARTGQYNILDVNPRIGGAFRLFLDQAGMDVARALYLDLTGQAVEAAPPAEGRRWLKEDSDIVAYAQHRRADGLRLGAWLRSLGGVDEAAYFWRSDPLPFAGIMTMVARDTLSARWRRRPSGAGQAAGSGVGARPEPAG